MRDNTSFTPLETLALSKMVADKVAKAARTAVKPGEYDGSTIVKVDWTMTVLEDTDRPASVTVDQVLKSVGRIAAAQYGEAVAEDLLARLEESIARRKKERVDVKGATRVVATITPVTVMAEGEATPVFVVETPKATKKAATKS